jgi:hypothetical protein
MLASLYDELGEHDRAIERYRAVVIVNFEQSCWSSINWRSRSPKL